MDIVEELQLYDRKTGPGLLGTVTVQADMITRAADEIEKLRAGFMAQQARIQALRETEHQHECLLGMLVKKVESLKAQHRMQQHMIDRMTYALAVRPETTVVVDLPRERP